MFENQKQRYWKKKNTWEKVLSGTRNSYPQER